MLSNKVTGVSREEFAVLASVCGIRRLTCLEAKTGQLWNGKERQREYNRAILGLTRKGILSCSQKGLVMEADWVRFFGLLREAHRVWSIYTPKRELPNLCLYPGEEGDIPLLREGAHEQEYLRLQLIPTTQVEELLTGEGYFPLSLPEEWGSRQKNHDLWGEQLRTILKEGGQYDRERLLSLSETETVLECRKADDGSVVCRAVIVRQPLQDKLLWFQGDEIAIQPLRTSALCRRLIRKEEEE